MFTIFNGTPQDIYIHWLILGLGIVILVSGVSVFLTCRSFTSGFLLKGKTDGFIKKAYSIYLRYHSYYWTTFWLALILHLMVTITHTGLPFAGLPYLTAHWFSLVTAVINLLLVLMVFSTCKSFIMISRFFTNKNPLNSSYYKNYYGFHRYIWILLIISLCVHIVFGMIHAVNT